MLAIVVGVGHILPLVLPVDEVEVVLAVGVDLDGPVCHFLKLINNIGI